MLKIALIIIDSNIASFSSLILFDNPQSTIAYFMFEIKIDLKLPTSPPWLNIFGQVEV